MADINIEYSNLALTYPDSEEPAKELNLSSLPRPTVRGKFFFVGEQKLWIKGVTYGTFAPDTAGIQFPPPQQADEDLAQMADNGINAIRTYTVPPLWFLDAACRYGLRVMVGIPWEQHIAFLDEKFRVRAVRNFVRAAVRSVSGHPAILCFTVGNEIPSPIVRWHGRRRIERFIKSLYEIVKEEDPEALVTYVNYPTTEYLQLPFLDFLSFNVYLESQEPLEAYLMRLQNLAEERPLVMAEVGLDSRSNGIGEQANVLEWQIRSAFRCGCAGLFVFAWTDEWHRGGSAIGGWDFGLTTRDRHPKPALASVARVYADSPFAEDTAWPAMSIVVCSYNGAATIRDTLQALAGLSYPNYEVIVVNDGSSDDTPAIASEYDVRLINTENRGLSSARNTGYRAARGEIVAYIDDDAYPDADWAKYLALAYLMGDYAGVGGPNLAPPGDGPVADCVANAPGGPVHVLLTDTVAEHIPGCNMSFRKKALEIIGGFDKRYRAAGDDVDLCWRVQAQVGQIGFHPAATVWHHRRNSVRMYWRQQQGYGKAEALLEEKWPEKYNAIGHTSWVGRLYGKGLTLNLYSLQSRIYQGVWGSAPFQSIYTSAPTTFSALPLMPEWYLLLPLLLLLFFLGVWWSPLLYVLPVLLLVLALPLVQAVLSARRARFTSDVQSPLQRLKLVTLTAALHLLQPLARLLGRLRHGLTPWRAPMAEIWQWPRKLEYSRWHEQWRSPNELLTEFRSVIRKSGVVALTGGDFDAWDLEIRGGMIGFAHLVICTEEHGAGKQMMRFKIRPRWRTSPLLLVALMGTISIGAALDGAWLPSAISAFLGVSILVRGVFETGLSTGTLSHWLNLESDS